jgi:hypothetical protein
MGGDREVSQFRPIGARSQRASAGARTLGVVVEIDKDVTGVVGINPSAGVWAFGGDHANPSFLPALLDPRTGAR